MIFLAFLLLGSACNSIDDSQKLNRKRILFLHHSTGRIIWEGGKPSLFEKVKRKLTGKKGMQEWFDRFNKESRKNYSITDLVFPKQEPYGWKNYPYDYYNIWVKNGGDSLYKEEPTLEILTKNYDVIIFKHCFPGSNIVDNFDNSDIDSQVKTLGNYKLQYNALKAKLHQYTNTIFIVWTGAALTEKSTTPENAERAKQFNHWVVNDWDEPNDNIYVWDFNSLETEGTLFLKDKYAEAPDNSHPNSEFAKKVMPLFCNRIVDIIENGGAKTMLTGELK